MTQNNDDHAVLTTQLKTGIYKVTQGEYKDAALFLIDVLKPEESDFIFLTIYNPDTESSHEIALEEWQAMVTEDGLQWDSVIPDGIKDKYLYGIDSTSPSKIPGL